MVVRRRGVKTHVIRERLIVEGGVDEERGPWRCVLRLQINPESQGGTYVTVLESASEVGQESVDLLRRTTLCPRRPVFSLSHRN